MATVIFYSWQSDTNPKTNRNLIKDALDRAIQRVGKSIDVEVPLRLDQDTKDVPGSPEIANTILQKIDTCGIFVPDLTFVARTADGKDIPNPNVLIEFGYAMKSVGSERIIAVMNEAYGTAAEGLPFDLAHRRWPIRYTLTEDEVSEVRNRKRDHLVSQLAEAIRTILESGVLPSGQQQFEFQVTLPKWQSSSFLEDGKLLATLVPFGQRHRATDIIWYNGSQAFLRLIPTKPTPEKSPFQLQKLAREDRHHLMPFGQVHGLWTERNQYGAVVFDAQDQERQSSAHGISQVFKNGEIWGISADLLNTGDDVNSIPSTSLEGQFESTLQNYLWFAQHGLGLDVPLKFVASLSAVTSFTMGLPPRYFERFGGHVVEDEIIYDGIIDDYATPVQTLLLPFFKQVWEACGIERPNWFRKKADQESR
jgi:hypothetical protein